MSPPMAISAMSSRALTRRSGLPCRMPASPAEGGPRDEARLGRRDAGKAASGATRRIRRPARPGLGWELEKPPHQVGDSLDIYLTQPARGSVELTFFSLTDFTSPPWLTTLLAAGAAGAECLQRCSRSTAPLRSHATRPSRDRDRGRDSEVVGEELPQAGRRTPARLERPGRALAGTRRPAQRRSPDQGGPARRAYYAACHSVVVKHAFVLSDIVSGRRFVHAG